MTYPSNVKRSDGLKTEFPEAQPSLLAGRRLKYLPDQVNATQFTVTRAEKEELGLHISLPSQTENVKQPDRRAAAPASRRLCMLSEHIEANEYDDTQQPYLNYHHRLT